MRFLRLEREKNPVRAITAKLRSLNVMEVGLVSDALLSRLSAPMCKFTRSSEGGILLQKKLNVGPRVPLQRKVAAISLTISCWATSTRLSGNTRRVAKDQASVTKYTQDYGRDTLKPRSPNHVFA
jgi:hypothetical protein